VFLPHALPPPAGYCAKKGFSSEALTYLDISRNDYDKAELDATLRKVGRKVGLE